MQSSELHPPTLKRTKGGKSLQDIERDRKHMIGLLGDNIIQEILTSAIQKSMSENEPSNHTAIKDAQQVLSDEQSKYNDLLLLCFRKLMEENPGEILNRDNKSLDINHKNTLKDSLIEALAAKIKGEDYKELLDPYSHKKTPKEVVNKLDLKTFRGKGTGGDFNDDPSSSTSRTESTAAETNRSEINTPRKEDVENDDKYNEEEKYNTRDSSEDSDSDIDDYEEEEEEEEISTELKKKMQDAEHTDEDENSFENPPEHLDNIGDIKNYFIKNFLEENYIVTTEDGKELENLIDELLIQEPIKHTHELSQVELGYYCSSIEKRITDHDNETVKTVFNEYTENKSNIKPEKILSSDEITQSKVEQISAYYTKNYGSAIDLETENQQKEYSTESFHKLIKDILNEENEKNYISQTENNGIDHEPIELYEKKLTEYCDMIKNQIEMIKGQEEAKREKDDQKVSFEEQTGTMEDRIQKLHETYYTSVEEFNQLVNTFKQSLEKKEKLEKQYEKVTNSYSSYKTKYSTLQSETKKKLSEFSNNTRILNYHTEQCNWKKEGITEIHRLEHKKSELQTSRYNDASLLFAAQEVRICKKLHELITNLEVDGQEKLISVLFRKLEDLSGRRNQYAIICEQSDEKNLRSILLKLDAFYKIFYDQNRFDKEEEEEEKGKEEEEKGKKEEGGGDDGNVQQTPLKALNELITVYNYICDEKANYQPSTTSVINEDKDEDNLTIKLDELSKKITENTINITSEQLYNIDDIKNYFLKNNLDNLKLTEEQEKELEAFILQLLREKPVRHNDDLIEMELKDYCSYLEELIEKNETDDDFTNNMTVDNYNKDKNSSIVKIVQSRIRQSKIERRELELELEHYTDFRVKTISKIDGILARISGKANDNLPLATKDPDNNSTILQTIVPLINDDEVESVIATKDNEKLTMLLNKLRELDKMQGISNKTNELNSLDAELDENNRAKQSNIDIYKKADEDFSNSLDSLAMLLKLLSVENERIREEIQNMVDMDTANDGRDYAEERQRLESIIKEINDLPCPEDFITETNKDYNNTTLEHPQQDRGEGSKSKNTPENPLSPGNEEDNEEDSDQPEDDFMLNSTNVIEEFSLEDGEEENKEEDDKKSKNGEYYSSNLPPQIQSITHSKEIGAPTRGSFNKKAPGESQPDDITTDDSLAIQHKGEYFKCSVQFEGHTLTFIGETFEKLLECLNTYTINYNIWIAQQHATPELNDRKNQLEYFPDKSRKQSGIEVNQPSLFNSSILDGSNYNDTFASLCHALDGKPINIDNIIEKQKLSLPPLDNSIEQRSNFIGPTISQNESDTQTTTYQPQPKNDNNKIYKSIEQENLRQHIQSIQPDKNFDPRKVIKKIDEYKSSKEAYENEYENEKQCLEGLDHDEPKKNSHNIIEECNFSRTSSSDKASSTVTCKRDETNDNYLFSFNPEQSKEEVERLLRIIFDCAVLGGTKTIVVDSDFINQAGGIKPDQKESSILDIIYNIITTDEKYNFKVKIILQYDPEKYEQERAEKEQTKNTSFTEKKFCETYEAAKTVQNFINIAADRVSSAFGFFHKRDNENKNDGNITKNRPGGPR